jgi:hypothetical protein
MDENQVSPAIREDVKLIGEPAELGALFSALAKAQGEFLPLGKESTAEVKNKEGKFLYNFDYCPLDAVIAATQPALTKYELAFVQLTNGDYLLTILAHGQARIESRIGLLAWETPQQLGAMLTYLKRYVRLGMLSVFPAGEDDDGNAASGNQAAVKPRERSAPPATQAAPKATAAHNPDALTAETKARVWALSTKAGFKGKDELDAFSMKSGCGALANLGEVQGLRLEVALQKLAVQP